MSYTSRTSDAYSRRPTDDRRRDSAPGDERDRRRRSTDASTKDRQNPPDSPRESRPAISTSARSLQRKASTSSFSGLDRGNASETPTELFKNYADAVSDWARLKSEKDTLDKALKKRKAEYERSVTKHAELFPSVPELRNMNLKRHLDHFAWLDAQIHKARRRVDNLAESLERIIADKPANLREGQPRTPIAGPSQQEISNLQAEISALQSTLQQVESEHAEERTKLRSKSNEQLEKMRQEMKQEMKQQVENAVNDIKKEMAEKITEATKKSKEEMNGDVKSVKDQLSTMGADFQKLQADFKQYRDDAKAKFSKQEKDVKAAKSGLSKTEITTLIQTETSPFKSSISGLTSDISELTSRVNTLSGERTSIAKDIASLGSRLADADRKIEEHETKLSGLDMEALDQAAEMSIGFPALQTKVDSIQSKMDAVPGEVDQKVSNIQTKVDAIPGEIDQKQEDLFEKVKAYVGKMGSLLGTQVDKVQNDVTSTKKRIEALMQASVVRPSLRGGDPSSSARDHTTTPVSESAFSDARAAAINANVEAFNAAIQELRNGNAELSERISKLIQGLPADVQGLKAEVEMLRHSVLVLSARFDHLSTKSLAEHIIGYLRQLYPEPDQLVADIKLLKRQLEHTGARIGSVETKLEDFKVKVVGHDEMDEPLRNGNGVAGHTHSENGVQEPEPAGEESRAVTQQQEHQHQRIHHQQMHHQQTQHQQQ
ncbi:hypothetical protein VTJ49DRAFT_2079 [Mycothermus thermophilus]|uniref:Paramyosin n=1 Tax=Humicola insolens TaxID=85995 RepID=A0ABR3VAZ2_HUMIN